MECLLAGGEVLHYDGRKGGIPGFPTRAQLIRRHPATAPLVPRVGRAIAGRRPLYFLPTMIKERNKYVGGVPVYRVYAFGSLSDGSKAMVEVGGIEPFFDIRKPGGGLDGFDSGVRGLFAQSDLVPRSLRAIKGRPLKGWCPEPDDWLRASFANLQERRRALALVKRARYEVASDDDRSYYRVGARFGGLVLAEWTRIGNYGYERGGGHPRGVESEWPASLNCEHTFILDVSDWEPCVSPLDGLEAQEKARAGLEGTPAASDRSLVLTWDLETYTGRPGDVPLPECPNDIIYMGCLTAHWADEDEPFFTACLVDKETTPDPQWVTVVCGDQRNLVRALARVVKALAPDIMVGFNDGRYDWPFVVARATQAGDLVDFYQTASCFRPSPNDEAASIAKYNIRNEKKIKIGSGNDAYIMTFEIPGVVLVDSRVVCWKLQPKAPRKSLNYFLESAGLPLKIDLGHKEMRRIYVEGDPDRLRQTAEYCVVDALSCQRLLVRLSIVREHRATASLTMEAFSDAYLYAGGGRVFNLTAAFAAKRGILCSAAIPDDVDKSHGKYPGALVIDPPRRGLHCDRPSGALDFASLYPSIIMGCGFSPERSVRHNLVLAGKTGREDLLAEADRLRAQGLKLTHVFFQFPDGFAVEDFFVRPDEDAGEQTLFGQVLEDLFNKRKAMKRKLGALKDAREHLRLVRSRAGEGSGSIGTELQGLRARPGLSPVLVETLGLLAQKEAETGPAAEDLDLKIMIVDIIQKSLKVFMNSYYGVTGYERSPLYMLSLAGGITTVGRLALGFVAEQCGHHGFTVNYGDTDSVYITPPPAAFAACDAAYAGSGGEMARLDHWTEMVKITMSEVARVRDLVNTAVAARFETKRLRLAYEEVLFPVFYLGKKKYGGIAHEKTPNFDPDELFIRGLENVKMTQTELARKITDRIMWRAVSPGNDDTLPEIVEDVLRDAVVNGAQWEFGDFIRSAAWRPNKKNISVQLFMARMQAAQEAERRRRDATLAKGGTPPPLIYVDLPEPGDRFDYVICAKKGGFDTQGRKRNLRKGDTMEFVGVARALELPIDSADYVYSYVVGQCARFIAYGDEFQPPPVQLELLTDREADKYTMDLATKKLKAFVQKIQRGGAETLRKQGLVYRQIWRDTTRDCYQGLYASLGQRSDMLQGVYLDWTDLALGGPAAVAAFAPSGDGREGGAYDPVAAADPIAELASRAAEAAEEIAPYIHTSDALAAWAAQLGIAPDGRDLNGGPAAESCLHAAAAAYPVREGRTRSRQPAYISRLMSILDCEEAGARGRLAAAAPGAAAVAAGYEAIIEDVVYRRRRARHAEDEVLREVDVVECPDHSAESDILLFDVSRTGHRGRSSFRQSRMNRLRQSDIDRVGSVEHETSSVSGCGQGAASTSCTAEEAAPTGCTAEEAAALAAEVASPANRADLDEFRAAWYYLVGIGVERIAARTFAAYIASLRDRCRGYTPPPDRQEMDAGIAAAAARFSALTLADSRRPPY